jgi:hypothetical protein
MKELPLFDPTQAISCTIQDSEVQDRIALLERMRAAMTEIARTDHGLLLTFNSDVEHDIRRFAVDEKRCCQFWGFDVATTGDAVTLRWDGPPAAQELVERLRAYFTCDEPIESLAALL